MKEIIKSFLENNFNSIVKNYDYLIDNLNKLEEKKDRLLNKNKTLEIKF